MSNASSEEPHPDMSPAAKQATPWGPAAAIIVAVLAFFGAQALAGIILSILASQAGLPISLIDTKDNQIAGQFYFVVLSDALMLSVVWFFLRSRRARLRQVGFGRRPVWKDVGVAVVGYLVYFVLLIIAYMVLGSTTQVNLDQRQELGFDHLFSSGEKIMALVALVILPPLVEETIFRGFVFTGLRTKLPFVGATIITSLLFASPHLLGSREGLLWIAGADTLILSFVLCYLREKTGALWAPIMVHATKNLIAFLLLLSGVASL